MTGLYDHQGVLRFAGRDLDDCLAYAELFGLSPESYSLACLVGWAPVAGDQPMVTPNVVAQPA